MIILVDGDSIAYTAAAAREGNPPTHAEMVNAIDLIITRIQQQAWNPILEIYVETTKRPKVNFRHHVAVSQAYKGNRRQYKTLEEQALGEAYAERVSEAKNILYKRYGAEFVNIYESEDMVAIRATELTRQGVEHIIAAVDKDLLQVPGKFYNYNTARRREITPKQGLYNFYTQLLMGDRVDNIPGLPGIGKAKAKKILDEVVDYEEYDLDQYEYALAMAVACAYVDAGRSYHYMLEQARLLYMVRTPDDVYTSPIQEEMYARLDACDDLREFDK